MPQRTRHGWGNRDGVWPTMKNVGGAPGCAVQRPASPMGAVSTKMRNHIRICQLILLFLLVVTTVQAQTPTHPDVRVQVLSVAKRSAQLRWRITNASSSTIYIYATFLRGPAFSIRTASDRLVIATTPVTPNSQCPNEFPNFRLESLSGGGSIEGIFKDSHLRNSGAKYISILIGVGPDAQSVAEAVKSARQSSICENPYNAIVRWQTIVESDPFPLSAGLHHDTTTRHSVGSPLPSHDRSVAFGAINPSSTAMTNEAG
jgi:hypothetical protein